MAACVVADAGTGVLSLSSADPCVTFVLLSPTEFSSLNSSPLNLAAEDGFTLSVAILGVWAAAWSVRQLIRTLDGADGGPTTD